MLPSRWSRERLPHASDPADGKRRINRDDDGNPHLDDVTIDRAIRELLTTTEFGAFDKISVYGPRWRQ
jgi:hypothetical protein